MQGNDSCFHKISTCSFVFELRIRLDVWRVYSFIESVQGFEVLEATASVSSATSCHGALSVPSRRWSCAGGTWLGTVCELRKILKILARPQSSTRMISMMP